jgi:hypothetical protein
MAIWQAKFTSFDGKTTYTANLTLEDKGNGHAVGTLRNLSGPVQAEEIELSGVVHGNQFIVGGSVMAVGINLDVTFAPYVFAFTGGARIVTHENNQSTALFLITQGVD